MNLGIAGYKQPLIHPRCCLSLVSVARSPRDCAGVRLCPGQGVGPSHRIQHLNPEPD